MEISPYMLSLLLLYSFLFGMSAGIVNDINKILRLFFSARREEIRTRGRFARGSSCAVIFFQDILLFTYMGVGTVLLNYYLNRGQFRIYSIAAVAAGFVLYYFTLGKIIMFFAESIVLFLHTVIFKLLHILLLPIKAIFKVIGMILKKLCKKIRFAIAKKKILRYNKRKKAQLEELSRIGFCAGESLSMGEQDV